MHVVGQQTVGPDFNAMPGSLLGQQIAICLLVAVLKEDRLAPVPPLSHMMPSAGNDDPSVLGHGGTIAFSGVWGTCIGLHPIDETA